MSHGLQSEPILRNVPSIAGFKVLMPCVLWDRIGTGGMGAVFLARHLNLDIDVAVKCLFDDRAHGDEAFVARFQREARVAAQINHPNLVRVYDVLEAHGVHYLVMEYVRGETLAHRAKRRGPLSRDEGVAVMTAAARGLAELHDRDVVHRDLKPANVLLSAGGEVKVADFGLVRRHGESEGITRSGTTFGTLGYMSPEQFEDASRVGPGADVWSLGATMFHALVGESAHPSTLGQTAIVGRILSEPFPDVGERRDDLDAGFLGILRRCNEPAPEDRFASARELLEALVALEPAATADLSDVAIAEARPGLEDAAPPSRSITREIQERLRGGTAGAASGTATAQTAERAEDVPNAEDVETGLFVPGGDSAPPPPRRSGSPEARARPAPSPGEGAGRALPPSRRRGWVAVAIVVLLIAAAAAVAIDRGYLRLPSGDASADGGAAGSEEGSRERPPRVGATQDGARDDAPEDGEAREDGGDTSSSPSSDPPPTRATFDRGDLIEAIRKVAIEVNRARGSLRDVEDSRHDIRIFRATGGMDAAIEQAEAAIDRARRLIEEYHSRAASEAVLVLEAAAAFPPEADRVLEEELQQARDGWKQHRIDAIDALQTIVSERPDRPEQYEGHARRGLAHLFPKSRND